MCNCQNHVCFMVPGYVLRHMAANSPNMAVREWAINSLSASGSLRTSRTIYSGLAPSMVAMLVAAAAAGKKRKVYDMNGHTAQFLLPGTKVRAENGRAVKDVVVNQAFDNSGIVYDFFMQQFQRNSIDGNGMTLVSSVHYGRKYNNAFWNGRQMVYGDGDGVVFQDFAGGLDVVGHELTHGITSYTTNLEYQDEPGALNEHFSDVMGILIKQQSLGLSASESDWLIGKDIMVASPTVKALRSFKDEKAYENDPHIGTDPQPKYFKDKYTGTQDYGGVHINSGIPNHAFYRIAMAMGGNAWDVAGRIWYEAFTKRLHAKSGFQDAAEMTYQVAAQYGSRAQKDVRDGWNYVGL
jgi:Zn-dependent metalloprotease